MKIIEKANLTMENALFGEKVFRANKTKVSNFDSEVVTDEWTENKKYTVTPTKDFISEMNITIDVGVKKGNIINIDMDGDGTPEKYLVLKVNNNIVELLARETPSSGTSIAFNSENSNIYEDKALDAYLNETYYATLSETAKSAIVDKTFAQDKWIMTDVGNPDYIGTYTSNGTKYPFTCSLISATYGSEITRHIYSISVQDVIDYFEATPEMTAENTTLTTENIRTMFNATSGGFWFRSAHNQVGFSMYINGKYASPSFDMSTSSRKVLPAFQIDLSKIEWSKDNA